MDSNVFPYGEFLRGLIANPKGVSAPTPSGPTLARAIAAQVDVLRDGLVLEFGPGTGVVTQALLDRGIAAARIVAVEQTIVFADLLGKRFPFVQVHCGDALAFEKYIPVGAKVAAIVSGLPLLQLPSNVRQSFLQRALAAQHGGGQLVQLSYSWRPPIRPWPGTTLHKATIWRNFPPAHIWTYRGAQHAARGGNMKNRED
jgi:phosphatidylethanolamine/phosphatidyl-N-methylethanolamine N-methyltransferase